MAEQTKRIDKADLNAIKAMTLEQRIEHYALPPGAKFLGATIEGPMVDGIATMIVRYDDAPEGEA